jgi:predicted PurR-regulated permease PerM
MDSPLGPEHAADRRLAARLLDVLIRAGLLLAVAFFSYRVFAPFLTLTLWAVILAVTLYPLHQTVAARLKGRQGMAATLLVLLGIALLVCRRRC